MRQAQVRHVSGEIVLAEFTAQAWIEAPLLTYARDGQATIIVRGIQQAGLRQRENPVVDRPEHRPRVAMLKIRPAGAPDQQTIAGKRHGFVAEHEADTTIRMTWRPAHFEITRAELATVTVAQIAVRAFGAARRRYRNPAARVLLEQPCAGDVIGMNVSVHRIKQAQPKLVEQCAIPAYLFEYRIDQYRSARFFVGKKVRVGRRLLVE